MQFRKPAIAAVALAVAACGGVAASPAAAQTAAAQRARQLAVTRFRLLDQQSPLAVSELEPEEKTTTPDIPPTYDDTSWDADITVPGDFIASIPQDSDLLVQLHAAGYCTYIAGNNPGYSEPAPTQQILIPEWLFEPGFRPDSVDFQGLTDQLPTSGLVGAGASAEPPLPPKPEFDTLGYYYYSGQPDVLASLEPQGGIQGLIVRVPGMNDTGTNIPIDLRVHATADETQVLNDTSVDLELSYASPAPTQGAPAAKRKVLAEAAPAAWLAELPIVAGSPVMCAPGIALKPVVVEMPPVEAPAAQ
jgi:hypothetical protein